MDLLLRNYKAQFPPQPVKAAKALRFGILGAANIAPNALICPAKSHTDVIIQAVAARDKKKAEAYARKHNIPQVLDSYTAILDDPSIDAVYIPLPNGLHFEWTLKALAKGKHVLLEKPAVSNATEAELLFRSPLLTTPRSDGSLPVLLEAFHYRFQPAWQYLLTLVDRPNIATVYSEGILPSYMFAKDDIRFRYDLAGGSIMDLGTYAFSTLRQVFGAEPEACVKCTVQKCEPPNELCDSGSAAEFLFPGGGVGTTKTTLQGTSLIPSMPLVRITHKPVPVSPGEVSISLEEGQECVVTRTLKLHNFILSNIWHRIDIESEYVVRQKNDAAGNSDDGRVIKLWHKKASKKIYTFKDAHIDQPSETYWLSYRHQLEQFVNRIRGREGSGVWVSAEDSIAQARMVDMAYEKTDLPLRPTSKYRPG